MTGASPMTGAKRSSVDQCTEVEMSPAEFLADIEVAVTDRDGVVPRQERR